jgi:predicted 3-demethylubiquinone-9 3-methyltransferase (glyoxalase superfamily)
MVYCDTQEEIDSYWKMLSAVPEAEQCGWIKDKYGLSWQIVPSLMDEMMQDSDPQKVSNLIQAILKMKKLNIAELQRVFNKKTSN